MHAGAILIKEAGQAIPSDVLKRALDNGPTFQGAVYIDNDTKQFVVTAGSGFTAEQLEDFQTGLLDQKLWLFFGKGDAEFSTESQQPFFVVSKEGVDEVLCFLDGDFSNYGETQSAHSDAFFFAQKQIAPMLQGIYEITEGDTQKLFTYMKKPINTTTLHNLWMGRAAMVLINRHGDNLIIEKDNPQKDHSAWGYISNNYLKPAAAAPAEKAKPTLGTPRSSVPTVKVESKQNPPGVHNVPPTVAHPPENKPEMITIERDEQPPKEFWGNKDKAKAWYRQYIAKKHELPTGWDSKTNPPSIKVRITVNKADHEAMMAGTSKTAIAAAAPTKDTSVSTDVAKNALPIPVLPVAQVEAIKNTFFKDTVIAKILDENAQQITSPKELQAIERQHPTFCEYTGLPGLEATFRWPFEKRVEFASKYARSSALLMQDLTYALCDALAKLEDMGVHEPGVGHVGPTKIETPKPAATTQNALGTPRKKVSM